MLWSVQIGALPSTWSGKIRKTESEHTLPRAADGGTIGAGGMLAIPVTLTDSQNLSDPDESGLNYFVAVVEAGGTTGPNSNIVILKLDPDAVTAALLYRALTRFRTGLIDGAGRWRCCWP